MQTSFSVHILSFNSSNDVFDEQNLVITKSSFSSFFLMIIVIYSLLKSLYLPKMSWTYSLLFSLEALLFNILPLRYIIYLRLKLVCELERFFFFFFCRTIQLTQYHLLKSTFVENQVTISSFHTHISGYFILFLWFISILVHNATPS